MILGDSDTGMISSSEPAAEETKGGSASAAAAASTQGPAQTAANKAMKRSLQLTARKIMIGFGGKLSNILIDEDVRKDGLLQTDKVSQIIKARNIQDLQVSELNNLISNMDHERYGFVVISNFMERLYDLAVETEYEVKLRRLAKTLSN